MLSFNTNVGLEYLSDNYDLFTYRGLRKELPDASSSDESDVLMPGDVK